MQDRNLKTPKYHTTFTKPSVNSTRKAVFLLKVTCNFLGKACVTFWYPFLIVFFLILLFRF